MIWLCIAILVGSVSSYSDYDLWNAARHGNLAEVENALSSRRSITLQTAENLGDSIWFKHGLGSTALHVASRYNHPKVVSAILDEGFDINMKDDAYKQSPLHVAGSAEVANMLIARGADLDIQDTYGYTPLIQAVVSGRLSTVKALLDAQADVSIIDKDGLTALHIAAIYNWPSIVELLLQKGADANQVSSIGEGRSALDVAKESNHQEVVDILEQFTAGPTMSPQLKSTLLTVLICGIFVIFAILVGLIYHFVRRKKRVLEL